MSGIDFRRLCELSQDGLIVTDAQGVFRFCNTRFASFTARTPGEIVGHSYLEFVHPDDADATREEVHDLNLGMPTFSFRNRWKHASGHWVYFAWVAFFDEPAGLIYGMCQLTEPATDEDLEEELGP